MATTTNKTNYRKIDIFIKDNQGNWVYDGTTTCAKTLKQAKLNFLNRYACIPSTVKCSFSKD